MAKVNEIDKIIAENIRLRMSHERGKRAQLAIAAGITPGTFSRIIGSKQHAGPDVVAKLAKLLGCDEIDLYQHPSKIPAPKKEPTFEDALSVLNYVSEMELSERQSLFAKAAQVKKKALSRVRQAKRHLEQEGTPKHK